MMALCQTATLSESSLQRMDNALIVEPGARLKPMLAMTAGQLFSSSSPQMATLQSTITKSSRFMVATLAWTLDLHAVTLAMRAGRPSFEYKSSKNLIPRFRILAPPLATEGSAWADNYWNLRQT